ncbi:MAG: AAA family ATPase [Clostridiales bacterium]|jgi:chromosome segregation protein|nr:AAA family ATPase [Clostridiales bacterium]
MKIKSLELHGFKSFVNKVTLKFDGEITSIVGPNGSGKSNISDAISWVLGEQSVKSLRGSKMQDIIFAGTSTRKPVGFAEVTLCIDNASHGIDIPFDEVAITRRVYRSGENEYLLNGRACRLKDIHEMLMDTGLGREGYSIIGQGKIAEILNSKPEDRRVMFEEAAGITKYRYRKSESVRKLASVDENLVRVGDIISELELQVEPLSRQAKKAQEYLRLREQLKRADVALSMKNISKNKDILIELNEKQQINNTQITEIKQKINEVLAEENRLQGELAEQQTKAEETFAILKSTIAKIDENTTNVKVLETKIENTNANIKRVDSEIAHASDAIDYSVKDAIKAEEAEVLSKIKAANDELEKSLRQKRAVEEEARGLEASARNASMRKQELSLKINMLKSLESSYDGYSKAVKDLMNARKNGEILDIDIKCTVAQAISAKNGLEQAIEVALGAASQNVIVANEGDAKRAIEFLRQRKAGRATFLPISSVKGKVMVAPNGNGIMGVACDFVEYDSAYEGVINQLLGHTIIVDNIDNAISFARSSGNKYRLVTLKGDLLNPGGAITGGYRGNFANLISRSSQITELSNELSGVELKCNEFEGELKNVTTKRDFYALEVERLGEQVREMEKESLLIKQKLAFEEHKISEHDKSIDRYNRERGEYEKLKAEYAENIEQKLRENAELENQKSEFDDTIAQFYEARRVIEEKVKLCNEQRAGYSEDLVLIEKDNIRLEGKLSEADGELERVSQRLWLDYEVSLKQAEEIVADFEQGGELESSEEISEESTSDGASDSTLGGKISERLGQEMINRLRKQIRDLGNVNVGSIEQFAEVSARYEFLTSQRDDLTSSKADLEKVISTLTKEMTVQFSKQFAIISAEFSKVFNILFDGGVARLELTSAEDILTSGVEIIVQPPGKALQNIQLLSGGEKSLVAICLLLSMMKVRPAPFCILDEIDAALDDINVDRYIKYLQGYTKDTQFILITHKRGTMEGSDTLYGVTMQEKGVSKLVELNLNDIGEKYVEEDIRKEA